ncbi:MAG: signal peptidase II [Planctomycetes bacterium]|nr:signal peptidase II [Planctomycetota bacterium]
MSRWQQTLALVFVAGTCVGCDQATKVYFEQRFERTGPESYLYDTIRLHFARNTGAFLSLGETLPAWTFIGMGVLLVAGMIAYLYRSTNQSWFSTTILALLVGGAVGNLIDRSLYGFVRDFLNVGIGPVRTGIFNVADVAITGGVLALLLAGMRRT